jgi:hypothetical protein
VTVEDVFGAILSDLGSIEAAKTGSWADDLGLVVDAKSAKQAMQDFSEIKARAELLREAIGDQAYQQALEIASEL